MDANLIYTKTPSGEEAVRQRTRVVQRNTRMVLILVDGKSTVDDLCQKTGNQQLVESALQELERDGLIVPKLEQDSVWEQSRKVAEEIKAAAVRRLSKEASPALAAAPEKPLSLPKPASPAEPFSIGPLSISPSSVYPVQQSVTPPATMAGEPPPAAVRHETAPDPAAGRRGVPDRDDDTVVIKPIQRGRSMPYVSPTLAVVLGLAAVLLLSLLVFVLYPYDRHRSDLEAGLSRIVGQQVRIGSVEASLLPRPAISLASVSIEEGEHLRVAQIRLLPEIFSLLRSRPSFSSVEIDSAVLDGAGISLLSRALHALSQSDPPARIGRLAFSRLQLSALGLSLGELYGEIARVDAAEALALASADRSLRLSLRGEGAAVVADFEGYGWNLASDSPYKFDSIQGKAVWDGRSLSIRGLDARIFEGSISGTMVFERAGKAALAADINVRHMSASRLASALGYANQFEGDLVASLRFTAQASEWGGILRQASGEGELAVQRGALGGMDLVEAVRRGGKGSVSGGVTRYESLKARLLVSPKSIRFSELLLNSGPLRATGGLEVARDGGLSGRLDVEIRGSATVLRAPVTAGETLRSPLLSSAR